MTRAEQLKYCKVCKKKEFNMQKGIVCSLTNEQATFDDECKDFEADLDAQKVEQDKELEKQKIEERELTGGLNSVGIKSGIAAGIILIILGIAWLIGGLLFLDRLFIYSFFVIISGIIALAKGISKEREKAKLRQKDLLGSNVLDYTSESKSDTSIDI